MSRYLALVQLVRSAGVQLRLKNGMAQFRGELLEREQSDWLAFHRTELTAGLIEELVASVLGESVAVAAMSGSSAGSENIAVQKPIDDPLQSNE